MARHARRLALAGAAIIAAAMPAIASAQARSFPVAEKAGLPDPYAGRTVSFADGVTGRVDLPYSTIPGYRPMVLDLFLPPKAGTTSAPRPLIVYVHGGGWVGGHVRQAGALSDFPGVLAALAKEGFVVASVEYRFAGEAHLPAQLQDVRAALRFLKDHANEYGIDPTRVAIWGGSAGGHLAALAALSCGVATLDAAPAAPGSECVQAAVTWYGVFDFAPLVAGGQGPPMQLLGCDKGAACAADRVRAASPISYIDSSDPPFLLIHGADDRVVAVTQSDEAAKAMKAAGMEAREIVIPGVDHSFIGKTPDETRAATLRAVNATFDFFHQTLDKRAGK